MTHGAGVQELQVEYEVVELHPQVAADARVEAARRQVGTVHKVGVVLFFWKVWLGAFGSRLHLFGYFFQWYAESGLAVELAFQSLDRALCAPCEFMKVLGRK